MHCNSSYFRIYFDSIKNEIQLFCILQHNINDIIKHTAIT
jgi:hypothetical protein